MSVDPGESLILVSLDPRESDTGESLDCGEFLDSGESLILVSFFYSGESLIPVSL